MIISDVFKTRLDLARSMGADDCFNPIEENFSEAIAGLTDGEMCDLTVEAAGISATAQISVDALRNSGTAVWIGNAQKMVQVDMQKIVTNEIKIAGSYIYSMEIFSECVSLLSRKNINIEPIITNTMLMEDGVGAFDLLDNNKNGSVIKIILKN